LGGPFSVISAVNLEYACTLPAVNSAEKTDVRFSIDLFCSDFWTALRRAGGPAEPASERAVPLFLLPGACRPCRTGAPSLARSLAFRPSYSAAQPPPAPERLSDHHQRHRLSGDKNLAACLSSCRQKRFYVRARCRLAGSAGCKMNEGTPSESEHHGTPDNTPRNTGQTHRTTVVFLFLFQVLQVLVCFRYNSEMHFGLQLLR